MMLNQSPENQKTSLFGGGRCRVARVARAVWLPGETTEGVLHDDPNPIADNGGMKPRKKRYRAMWTLATVLGGVLIASCQTTEIKASKSHFLRPTDPPVHIAGGTDIVPEVVANMKEGAAGGGHEEVYTITVTEMPVRDLMFALARDANKNIDVYPGISGRVTLSAIDQTLPQILDRVAKQVGIRYEIDGETVIVSPDRPYLKIYQVDYINVKRETLTSNKVSTKLSTSSSASADLSSSDDNQSATNLSTSSVNNFWINLTKNIQSILGSDRSGGSNENSSGVGGEDSGLGGTTASKVIPAAGAGDVMGSVLPPAGGGGIDGGSGSASGSEKSNIVAVNPEAGLISVFASSLQHERIQKYLNTVLDNVHRQVLIESTVVEVELFDGFQEGVDWNKVINQPSGLSIKGVVSQLASPDKPVDFFTIQSGGEAGSKGSINLALKALETFGNTKVLSSPKIMALNNQAALLKVVQNRVFFTLESSSTPQASSTGTTTTPAAAQIPVFNTKIHTVPVGLIISVTPQISDNDIVSLNVRPTISRITGWVNDPNPALQRNTLTTGLEAPIISQIPEIEVKEMETLMRVHSGQVAVMGGLMKDESTKDTNGLPVLGRLPGFGFLFGSQAQSAKKTELVIFLRPVVMSQGKPRDFSGREPKKSKSVEKISKPEQKPAKTDPAKDEALPEKGGAPESKEGGAAMPEPVGGTENPVPASAPAPAPVSGPEAAPAAMAPGGGSYLDFTRPGGVVSMGENMPGVSAQVPGDPAGAMGQDAMANFAPPPARPALPPEEQDPALPMDRADAQPYGQTVAQAPGVGPGIGRTRGSAKGVYLELGSYRQQALADNVQSQVSAIGLPIYREEAMVAGTPYQRVRSGPYNSKKDAAQARDRIASLTGIEAKLAGH